MLEWDEKAECTENLPNVTGTETTGAQRASPDLTKKRYSPRHVAVKLSKVKNEEIILKDCERKMSSYIGRKNPFGFLQTCQPKPH